MQPTRGGCGISERGSHREIRGSRFGGAPRSETYGNSRPTAPFGCPSGAYAPSIKPPPLAAPIYWQESGWKRSLVRNRAPALSLSHGGASFRPGYLVAPSPQTIKHPAPPSTEILLQKGAFRGADILPLPEGPAGRIDRLRFFGGLRRKPRGCPTESIAPRPGSTWLCQPKINCAPRIPRRASLDGRDHWESTLPHQQHHAKTASQPPPLVRRCECAGTPGAGRAPGRLDQ